MSRAAAGGHIEIVKLCKKWGATYFDLTMIHAAREGHVEIIKLCKEWGATDFDLSMIYATERGRVDILKLCRLWLGYEKIHEELFRYHHKRRFYKNLHNELLPITWHPDRAWDWCFDEDEKKFINDYC